MPLNAGQVLNNRYRITALLGSGGYGAVYHAWDITLNTPVAVKEYQSASPGAAQQFALEARQLAVLRHPNLPYVIDHFNLPGQGQYLVMEFVEGQDLQNLLLKSGKGLPVAQILPWFEQVCEAVGYLHLQSPPIIHRDIKPANIRIASGGKAVLVDFGIARTLDPARRATIAAGAGGQGFAAPELNSGSADARSDIYSLGAVLYAALTGRPPVDSVQRQMGQPLPYPRQLNPSVSPSVEAAITQAMDLDPAQRYRSVEELKSALNLPSPAVQFVPRVELPSTIYTGAPGDYEQVPAQPAKSSSRLLWIALAAIAFCFFASAIAAVLAYVWFLAPGITRPTWVGVDLSQTQTALAILAASPTPTQTPVVGSPTPTITPIVVPSMTPTLPLPIFSPSPTGTFTIPPSPSITAPVPSTWQPCSGTYPSRLYAGGQAYVSYDPPLPNRVRRQPNASSEVLGFIQPGEKVEILEGPSCSNAWIWWRVRSQQTGLTGWTAEGDANAYWLVPVQ